MLEFESSLPMSRPALSTTVENARRLVITKQHLAGKPVKSTIESILSVVRDLCYVQWDPVDAVAPSHMISFWSRLGNFRLSDLDGLLWNEKKLFLHWAPMASIVLTEDYPIYSSIMRRYPESLSDSWGGNKRRATKFLAENKDLRRKLLSELKKRGPLRQNQFEDYARTKSPDGWTPGSKVSQMLYYLIMTGEIMVVNHEGLQNVYGLSGDFLPRWVDRKKLSEEEFEHQAAQRALRALGTASPREIHIYFPRGCYLNLKKTIANLEKDSTIRRINVEGLGRKGEQYIHEQDIPLLESMSEEWEPRMTLISPFDNLICLQGRTKRLFSFDYIHENFLPKNKRKYGTFVHPIMYGDKFIGRVDLLKDKQQGKLNVVSIHAEPDAPSSKEVASMIEETIGRFGEFLGIDEVVYPSRVPNAWRAMLH